MSEFVPYEVKPRYGAPNSPGAAPPAPREAPGEPPAPPAKPARRGFLRWFRTAVVTLGTFYVFGWIATIGLVSWMSGRDMQVPIAINGTARLAAAAPILEYRFAADPSITPDEAGVAVASLTQATAVPRGFTIRADVAPADVPWRALPFPDNVFPRTRPSNPFGIPGPPKFFELVRGPLTADQKKVLRIVGSAPVWHAFDRIAHAGTVDLIGGRVTPEFGPEAWAPALPSALPTIMREFTGASIARAAWHLSEGRRDSAEFALRAMISFAATVGDNTFMLYDRLLATVMIDNGGVALYEFWKATGDPRTPKLQATFDSLRAVRRGTVRLAGNGGGSAEAVRGQLLSVASDASLQRSMRYDVLSKLPYTMCGNPIELATGKSSAVHAAFDAARRDLARFPSERAYLDLAERDGSAQIARELSTRFRTPLNSLAAVVATIYFNPRISACVALGQQAQPR